MVVIDHIMNIISASLIVFMQFVLYSNLSEDKNLKLNIKNISLIIVCGIFVYLNTFFNNTYSRLIISFLTIWLVAIYIFKDSLLKSFLYMLCTYIIILVYEILFALTIVNLNITSSGFDNNIIFKTAYSIIVMILGYFTVKNKRVKTFINKIVFKLNNSKFMYLFLSIILIFVLTVDYANYKNFNIEIYFNTIMLLVSMSLIIAFGIYNYLKANKELERIEILLSFIEKYEKVIDEDRELRHEILNNLLILNSFEDKNTLEYEDVLNDLINQYNRSGTKSKNIYKLPSGLKGLLYYKLFGLEDEGFKINIRISKTLPSSLKKISNKDYLLLCRLVNIILDNAVEASRISKDKIINIEVYEETKNCIILIENTCSKKVDLNMIEEKNYSTKGKGRGLGLYIAKKLLKDSDKISLVREVNGLIFTTKIIVK
ncbi:MAG: GHKL domain-containing protein [bacterium]|nr:GHKL domain-containing protein [bacterium]